MNRICVFCFPARFDAGLASTPMIRVCERHGFLATRINARLSGEDYEREISARVVRAAEPARAGSVAGVVGRFAP